MKTVLPTSSQSSHLKTLQTQLFYALIFQTLIPVILMHTPAFFIFIATFLDCSFELLGQIPSITIVLYPAIDPLPNIFIIRNYRIATLNYLRKALQIFFKGNLKIGISECTNRINTDSTINDTHTNVATVTPAAQK
uniref:G_PROTEIN_RECEP_F1_2 domain-containing protein n=1 Tax=Caenorhabditis tropicalis TaxID=1561998 RepID=A0A1I7V0B4_9PELO